ncbi:hypothetical protein MPSI1_001860 [Malassezia psittaci]|uniref:Uncharacterized protein n=1 Tax=Malassezia psittaci TaxID=1821823 RepID=A0AAF0F992_9BASI|nr:hypothetical protein MPSI1_001860 [Malassezia psittaci]
MASKELPALPSASGTRRSISGPSAPVLPPIDIPPSIPLSTSQRFSASVPNVSTTRSTRAELPPAVPYFGKTYQLAPRAGARVETHSEKLSENSVSASDSERQNRMSYPLAHQSPMMPSQTALPSPSQYRRRVSDQPAKITQESPAAVPRSLMADTNLTDLTTSYSATDLLPIDDRSAVGQFMAQENASHLDTTNSKVDSACDAPDSETIIDPPISPEMASGLVLPCLIIEYCDRCRWQHRATWIQTEVFLTFSAKDAMDGKTTQASGGSYLASSMLIPRAAPETAGRFRVYLASESSDGVRSSKAALDLIWDRKQQGKFPELPELKRLIRDRIAPSQSLGHSEKS